MDVLYRGKPLNVSDNPKPSRVKKLLSIIIVPVLLFCSCTTHQQSSQFQFPVDSIRLLVADTAIFGYQNWPAHQQTNKVIPVADYDVGFVDSSGKAAHQPLQTISFTKPESDTLLTILRSYEHTQLPPTSCVHFYRHVFQCYYAGKVVKQISMDGDCHTLYIEPEKQNIDLVNREANKQLLSLLDRKKVYLYGGREFWGVE